MGKEMFSFSLNSPPSSVSVKGTSTAQSSSGITKEYLELALEKQRLEFEKMQLEKELLMQDDEDEEEEAVGMMGAVEEAIKDKMPELLTMFVGMLTNQFAPKTPISTGIGSSIDEIISEFRTINPDIESDLHKLLQLAKNKPALFKMLIEQLRAM